MTDQVAELNDLVASLGEILDDASVPKNVRIKIQSIITSLKESGEISIIVNRALSDLDEISSDVNLQAYTRTQIWNVMSIMEKFH